MATRARPREKGIFSVFLVRFGREVEDGGVSRVAGETGV
jgi:hypothetical protein